MTFDILETEISEVVILLNAILINLCHLLALFVIGMGVTKAIFIFLKDGLLNHNNQESFQNSRLAMGYSFSLGLSFLIGATILQTIISSRWDDIGRLTAIIAVRTLLNYLLLQAINSTKDLSASSSNPLSKNIK